MVDTSDTAIPVILESAEISPNIEERVIVETEAITAARMTEQKPATLPFNGPLATKPATKPARIGATIENCLNKKNINTPAIIPSTIAIIYQVYAQIKIFGFKMKFVHFTDTHLGKNEAKLEEREEDFRDAFKQVIDFSLNEKVDFVIHSGDMFDRARPKVKTLVFVVEQLSRLKDAKIPFFISTGSHDIGVEETIISLLESVGLLTNLNAPRYYIQEDGKIKVGGETVGDCFICGIAGKRARIEEIYKNLEPEQKGKFNIFMFHHIVSDISEKFADIPSSLLPKGFDYYAGGHWHSYAEFNHGRGKIIYPGSTEYNDLSEMERDKEKFFVSVNTKPFSFEKRPIKTRKVVSIELDCTDMDAKEVSNKVTSRIKDTEERPILIVKLKGKLAKGIKSEIDRNKINSVAREKNYLYVKTYLGSLENPETPFISSKSKTPAQIEKNYLEKQEYSKQEIDLAQRLINVLGKKMDSVQHKDSKQKAIELLRDGLFENKKD